MKNWPKNNNSEIQSKSHRMQTGIGVQHVLLAVRAAAGLVPQKMLDWRGGRTHVQFK